MNVTYPTASDARALAKKYRLQGCIIFFAGADGRTGYAVSDGAGDFWDSTRYVAQSMWVPYARAMLGLGDEQLGAGRLIAEIEEGL